MLISAGDHCPSRVWALRLAVREFWEKMTRIRLEYLPTPPPVGTAVRVAGLICDGFLIAVEAIAVVGSGQLIDS
jgi:2-iminobutanoate/2-iminopropanoate deaminase